MTDRWTRPCELTIARVTSSGEPGQFICVQLLMQDGGRPAAGVKLDLTLEQFALILTGRGGVVVDGEFWEFKDDPSENR